jgi:hypothetical protein
MTTPIDQPLPPPPIPSDVNLQGMEYMPLYMERLRRSRAMILAAAEPAAGFSMRLLWEESWFSLPAGSLEDDELQLAAAARCSRAEFEIRRPIALYGWRLCSDGRLYHPVICEIAWATWQERLKARYKLAADRLAKANKRAIDDAQRPGRARQHVDLAPTPDFEAWVRQEYPVTAERLFPPAAQAAAANSIGQADLAQGKGGGGPVAATSPPVAATDPPCPTELSLKAEGRVSYPPPSPPCAQAATGQENGSGDWQRREDFAAYLDAVGQPDAPTETCWRQWLAVVADLPPRRVLLARVSAWKAHCDQQNEGRDRKVRPMGPARLLREGTLANFAAQADQMLASGDQLQDDRAAQARAAWGDLFQPIADLVGGEAVFVAWFYDAKPQREGDTLIVWAANSMRRRWIQNHFEGKIARALKCRVEVKNPVDNKPAETKGAAA